MTEFVTALFLTPFFRRLCDENLRPPCDSFCDRIVVVNDFMNDVNHVICDGDCDCRCL